MNSKNPAVPSNLPSASSPPALRLLALALAAAFGSPAGAQPAAVPGANALQPSTTLQPAPRSGDAARPAPIILQADTVTSRPDLETVAEGNVEFRRGGLVIRADRLSYENPSDLAKALGHVRVARDGAIYSGPELQLHIQRFEGYFLEPRFEFTQLGAGGRAQRIDFIDSARSRAIGAEYTSCPRDDGGVEPAWVLRTDKVEIDLDKNEGRAEGAVLRFLGTPILALPALSFPLSDARKSGWLPPSVNTDNRSGIELAVPWYWNIAENRDATLTPRVITRRGLGLDSEFRYLEPRYAGTAQLDWLPDDRISRQSRHAWSWLHEGTLWRDARYGVDVARVSDDDYWKDFPGRARSVTPRLLPLSAWAEQPFGLGRAGEGLAYARVQRWQVLQGSDRVVISPYERSPQLGVRAGGSAGGIEWGAEAEYNRFTLPSGEAARAGRHSGERVHLLGHVAWPLREPGWWVVPRLAVNSAHYGASAALTGDGQRRSRTIPTFSVDTGLEFERDTQAFGRALRQTLEPRLLYVRTPYREQRSLPSYDAAAKDFNFVSVYSDNPFAGVDRVADAHALTAGVTTRFVDVASGAEALRLGLVQRYLFRRQLVTPQADGSPDGPPLDQRFSDALLLGSTTVFPGWTLDAAVQYSPDLERSVRSIVGARWSPGPFRTVGATYRLARGLSEQVEVGWQWPVYGPGRRAGDGLATLADGTCKGTWYSVGRVSYSMKDSRITDSILGVEYDAGCWIGRFVAERLSTGRSEATTRLMLQLELVGLSRLGSNPLRTLKENIPGYRLLREERSTSSSAGTPPASFHD
jgi:LPS-assembly protein